MTVRDQHVWRAGKTGLLVLARVTPRSARDAVEGLVETPEGPALKVRVRAVAEDGQANRSVAAVVAKWLGLPNTQVAVAHGGKSRVKTLAVDGRPDELQPLLAARLAALQQTEHSA